MSPTVYVRLITGDTESFTYLDTAIPERFSSYTYKLGDIILNLLDLDIEAVKNRYAELLEGQTEIELKSNYEVLTDIRLQINNIDETYPALWFHTHLLYYCIADVLTKDTFHINNDLLSLKNAQRILENSIYRNMSNEITKSHDNISLYYQFLIAVLSEDIGYWKSIVLNEIELIFKYSSYYIYKQLSPAQRLYFLDRVDDRVTCSSPFTYADYTFKTRMILDNWDSAVISIKPKERAKEIIQADTSLNEMYVLNTLKDYLQFELIKFIMSDLPLLQCQNCGRIFIPRGRPDIKYCDKVAKGETLPCDAIGALRVYNSKVANDPIFKAFNKAYKRMNSRIKYKTLSQLEFYEWSENARAMRAKCISGEISLEEFNDWLGNKPLG